MTSTCFLLPLLTMYMVFCRFAFRSPKSAAGHLLRRVPEAIGRVPATETDDVERGKAIAPESSIAVREFTKWTDEMDFRLPSAMLDEARLGNRVDGNWTTQAYNNMVESLRQSGLIGITKNNVKNRLKSLKDIWREVHDLFSGLSGFALDESTKRFSAEPEVWDELLTTKPSAANWRVNPIRYYDLMEELWGANRATGHMARTARQTRRNITQSTFTVDLNDDVENIPEEQPFDAGFDTVYRSPPHMDLNAVLVMVLDQYHLFASLILVAHLRRGAQKEKLLWLM
ncbi:hypothetical protein Fmac_021128 [Flemingia macrophylla]|uniref:Myb/SANT-like domain-containing protein n=1 Tax=Flemingia macrophylla TaxID=520843 RepID=A0ABD1LW00_9FABA